MYLNFTLILHIRTAETDNRSLCPEICIEIPV